MENLSVVRGFTLVERGGDAVAGAGEQQPTTPVWHMLEVGWGKCTEKPQTVPWPMDGWMDAEGALGAAANRPAGDRRPPPRAVLPQLGYFPN